MKTKTRILALLFISICFNSCQDDNKIMDELEVEVRNFHPDITTYASEALLKRVYTSGFEQSEPKWISTEYEYDDNRRITKASTPMYDNGTPTGISISYDLYEYNTAGQLVKITNYNYNINTPDNYWNLQTIYYTYNDKGLKTKEVSEYPIIGQSDYSLFHYKNKQLIKKEFYDRGILQDTYTYEYNNSGQLIREEASSSDGKCYSYTQHTYQNALLTASAVYSIGSAFEGPARVIRYYYDSNDNLIVKTSQELFAYSSMSSNSVWYEYE